MTTMLSIWNENKKIIFTFGKESALLKLLDNQSGKSQKLYVTQQNINGLQQNFFHQSVAWALKTCLVTSHRNSPTLLARRC